MPWPTLDIAGLVCILSGGSASDLAAYLKIPGVHMVAPKSLSMQELARKLEAGYWAKQKVETHTPEASSPDPILAWAPVQTTTANHAKEGLPRTPPKNKPTLVSAMM